MKSVVILLDELGRLVANGSSKMPNEESFIVTDLAMVAQFRFAGQCKPEVGTISRVNRFGKVARARLGQFRFLVENMEDAARLGFDQIDAILIVDVDDLLDTKAFLFVEQLFFLEDALVEELLQFLVTVIDAELLKAVDREVFEARNVQYADVVR